MKMSSTQVHYSVRWMCFFGIKYSHKSFSIGSRLFSWLITSRAEVDNTASRNGHRNSGRTFLSVVTAFGDRKEVQRTQATPACFLPVKGVISHRLAQGPKKDAASPLFLQWRLFLERESLNLMTTMTRTCIIQIRSKTVLQGLSKPGSRRCVEHNDLVDIKKLTGRVIRDRHLICVRPVQPRCQVLDHIQAYPSR